VGQILSERIQGFEFRADGRGVTCHPGDLKAFLDEIVPAIGMTLVPSTSDFPNPCVSEAHGQGIAVIAESHVWVGVVGSEGTCIAFSCRRFDPEVVLSVLRNRFGGRWRSRFWVERSRQEDEMKPYILNKTLLGLRIVVHRRAGLVENCNTDGIKHRGEADALDPRWHKCRWCWPKE
jgi:hypothetical protein